MNLKLCVRRGVVGESIDYDELITFNQEAPEHVLLILEGKGRRKLNLGSHRYLYESYFPNSFIGVEDVLRGRSRTGGAGVFPGSHYILWGREDFLKAIQMYPELVKKAIDSFSQKIRLYDARKKVASSEIKHSKMESLKNASTTDYSMSKDVLSYSLYQMNFSDTDEFPQDIIDNFSVFFKKGEYVLRQGDKDRDIFIILSGEVTITRNEPENNTEEEIDFLGPGEFIGEMSMFDGLPRSANVIANSDLLALRFDERTFHLIFSLHQKWSLKILNTLAERIEKRRIEFERLPINLIYKL